MFSPFSSSSSAAASSSQRVPSPSALWLEALERLDVDGAVLFADDRAATALACAVGLPMLLDELGVVNVLPLDGSGGGVGGGEDNGDGDSDSDSFDEASSSAHVVVLCSTFLPEAYSALRGALTRTHRDLALTRCTIACSYTERAHAAYAPNAAAANAASGGVALGAYEACRAEVARWLGGDGCGCEVRVVHLGLPAQLTPLGSAFFLLAADGVRPLLQCDLPDLRRAAATREERSGGGGGDGSSVEGTAEGAPPVAKVEDALWSSLPAARQRSLGGVALSLAGMLRAAAVQPTLFTLGATSLLVARELMQHLPDSSSSSSSSAAGAAGGGAAPTEGASTAPSRPTVDASLLIVDRTLDLVAPSMTNDHPLDRLLNAAHKADEGAARHKATLAASAGTTASCASSTQAKLPPPPRPPPPPPPPTAPKPPIPPAMATAVCSPEPACVDLLDSIILSWRGKEVAQQLLKVLASIAEEQKQDDDVDDDDDDEQDRVGEGNDELRGVSIPSRPTSTALRTLLAQLRSARRVCWERLPELETVEALLDASDATGTAAAATGELVSHQKLLQYTASESAQAAFGELITLAVRAHATRAKHSAASAASATATVEGGAPTGVRELLPLAAMVYSLAGDHLVGNAALEEEGQRLREALLQACLRDPLVGGLLAPGAPAVPIEALSAEALMARKEQLGAIFRTVFTRLDALAIARRGLGASEPLLLSSAQATGDVYRPLLRHLMERAMKHEDIAEMRRPNSNYVGSLFSRGANLLGVKTRARLTDHTTIIVFVIGGISLAEVRELRQIVAQHPKHRLLIGATQVASPASVWELLTAGLQRVR